MNWRELREELREVSTIYVVGIYYSRSGAVQGWTKFRLYYVKDGKLKEIYITPMKKEDKISEALDGNVPTSDYPANWVPPHKTKSGTWVGGYFESRAIGVDRAFQIVYNLGLWLYGDGYRFKYVFLSH